MNDNASVRVAFLSDTHLGYSAGRKVHGASGLNMRDRDGLVAFRETITQIIEAQPDLVIHGGDTFHKSWPSVGSIVWARQQFDRLVAAGIPVVGNTGNHDASSERGKSPATAAVSDPSRGIEFVTEPYKVIEPIDGLLVHVVSHYGLAQSERLLPEAVEGKVNIFTAHGAAMLPGHEVFRCVDSPGEVPIGLDMLLDPGFAVKLLGHYHGMDEIMDSVWYAGSSVRRGFSDPAGGRGWLMVNVMPSGDVEVERRYINQRPQYDLPAINASGLSGAEVEEQIRENLAQQDLGDAIVRQVVTNCSLPTRQGIDQPALAALAEDTLMWMPDFRRPEATDQSGERTVEGVSSSLRTAGSADLPSVYHSWIGSWADEIDLRDDLKSVVVEEGGRHLRAASVTAEGGDYAAPATSPAPTAAPQGGTLLAEAPPAPPADPFAEPPMTEADEETFDVTTGEKAPW